MFWLPTLVFNVYFENHTINYIFYKHYLCITFHFVEKAGYISMIIADIVSTFPRSVIRSIDLLLTC